MPNVLTRLQEEWKAASISQRLAIVSDASSLVGFSVTTLLGAIIVETLRPGRVSWPSAILVLSGTTLLLGMAIAVHAVVIWFASAARLDSGTAKWVVRLFLTAYWLFLFSTALTLAPQVVQSVLGES